MGSVDRGLIMVAGSRSPNDGNRLGSIRRLTDDAITRFHPRKPSALTEVGRQAAAGWVRKSSWRIMTAQPMRASLLATATAASLRGLLASSLAIQGFWRARLEPRTDMAPFTSRRRR